MRLRNDFLDKGVINGFSGTPVAVLVPTEDKKNFEIEQMKWGFIPPYVRNREDVEKFRYGYKDQKTGKWRNGYTTLNATDDGLFVNDKRNKSFVCRCGKGEPLPVIVYGFL